MKIYSYSLQGKRESNEDQHVNIINLSGEDPSMNSINLFCIFDGHGGKLVSKYLKDNLPQYFLNYVKKDLYINSDITSKYFIKLYNHIQNKLKKDHPKASQYCGSTACIAIQYKDIDSKIKMWLLNVGDSRTIKCNKFNIAEQLTQDHKPNSPEERLRIERLGGTIEYDGCDWRIKDLSLSRAFGDIECTPYVTHLPQIYKYKISSGDKFIIFACDGLWDIISNQDAIDYINNLLIDKKFNGNYAKKIAEYALEKGSLDNITVIIQFLI